MKRILVLCTGNSCRSQMAEAYLKKYLGIKAQVYSAGIKANGVHPRAIQIMLDDGIDISSQTSNEINEYEALDFDIIITVCDHAKENCPYFSSSAQRFHYNFPDPADAVGEADEIMEIFRKVRDQIKAYCFHLVQNNLVVQ